MSVYALAGYELETNTTSRIQSLVEAIVEIKADVADVLSFRYRADNASGAEVALDPFGIFYKGSAAGYEMPETTEIFVVRWSDAGQDKATVLLNMAFVSGKVEKDGIFALAGDALPHFAGPRAVDAFLREATLEPLSGDGDHVVRLAASPSVMIPDDAIFGADADLDGEFVFADFAPDAAEDWDDAGILGGAPGGDAAAPAGYPFAADDLLPDADDVPVPDGHADDAMG